MSTTPKSHLKTEPSCEEIELDEWQVQEIREAIREANDGFFASDKGVAETVNKWILAL